MKPLRKDRTDRSNRLASCLLNVILSTYSPARSRTSIKLKILQKPAALASDRRNRMKIKTRLIAIAVSAAIPLTLVAQSPSDSYQNAYQLKISVPGVPWPITAVSIYEPDGTLKEIDYLPTGNFLGVEGQVGHGHWSRTASGQFVINYKTEWPNGQVREVHALTTLSASGNELTGTATVTLLNQNGSVADTKNVTVTGERAPSRLIAKRS